MNHSEILAALRKESGYTQTEVAEHLSRLSGKSYTHKAVSNWESGVRTPHLEQFFLLCELYGVSDVLRTFRGIETEFNVTQTPKLNSLGRSRVEEYIALLSRSDLFSETGSEDARQQRRFIRLYDVPVAAGTGNFLDGDSYEDIEADKTVPDAADFAVRVSGDSMTPRFVDGQIIFIKGQNWLDVGEIGIFALNGDSFVKKLGQGELVSLNARYKPIPVGEFDDLRVFGKVVG